MDRTHWLHPHHSDCGHEANYGSGFRLTVGALPLGSASTLTIFVRKAKMVSDGSTPSTMIFQERKQPNDAYSYDVEDVFGTVHIESSVKLTGDILDGIVMVLLKQNISAEEIRGEVKHNKGVVQYVFKKRPMWEDEDEAKQPCNDTNNQIIHAKETTHGEAEIRDALHHFKKLLELARRILSRWIRKVFIRKV